MPLLQTPGIYKLRLAHHVARLNLYSSGACYHVRELAPGVDAIEFNCVHPDTYSANVDLTAEYLRPIDNAALPELPKPERQRMKDVVLKFNPTLTGTPARIFTMLTPAVIEIAPEFYDYPKQIRYFILLHEKGHMLYATEWKTDAFAVHEFLKAGFNASQAFHALADVLGRSPQAVDRVKRMFNTLKSNGYVGS